MIMITLYAKIVFASEFKIFYVLGNIRYDTNFSAAATATAVFNRYVRTESDTDSNPQNIVLNGGRVTCPAKVRSLPSICVLSIVLALRITIRP